ncbi:hypothetical protein PTKIN_Ptkin03bG0251300 [Pterospermum kingtungense]
MGKLSFGKMLDCLYLSSGSCTCFCMNTLEDEFERKLLITSDKTQSLRLKDVVAGNQTLAFQLKPKKAKVEKSIETVQVNFNSKRIRTRSVMTKLRNAKASQIQNVDDPFLIEAFAAVEALNFATDCGFKDIILEGDALTIIKKLLNHEEDRSALAHQVEEGRLKISNSLKCKIQHCPRSCNEAAHHLAKFILTMSCEIIWMEECPNCIESFVHVDAFSNE